MRPSPMQEALLIAVCWVATVAAGLTIGFRDLTDARPSVELLQQLAQVGAAMLIAYSVAIAAAERDLRKRTSRRTHERWIGFAAGVGVCGLAGVAVSLGLSAHRDAGYANLLDDIGFCWSLASIGMLGIVVASLPVASYEWRKDPGSDSAD